MCLARGNATAPYAGSGWTGGGGGVGPQGSGSGVGGGGGCGSLGSGYGNGGSCAGTGGSIGGNGSVSAGMLPVVVTIVMASYSLAMAAEPTDLSAFPNGTPVGEIAAHLGVPVRAVRALVRRRPSRNTLDGTRTRGRPDVDPAEVAALYAEGRSIREVAERLGCGKSTVERRLRRSGVALRGRTDPVVDAEIVRRYEAGERLGQIAAAVGRSPDGVHDVLCRLGVERRRKRRRMSPVGEWPNGGAGIDTSDVVAMYKAGWSQIAIAEHYGCSRALVQARLRAAGVPPKWRRQLEDRHAG